MASSRPLRPKIITIGSLKGGIGKSTLVLNLARGLQVLGQKVLLLDLTPVTNSSILYGMKDRPPRRGLIHVLKGIASPSSVIHHMKVDDQGGFDFAVTGITTPNEALFFEKEAMGHSLSGLVKEVAKGYDVVLCDSPSGLGSILKAVLECSEWALPVSTCEADTLRALPLFLSLISWMKLHRKRDLRFGGVVITKFDRDSKIQEGISRALSNRTRSYFLRTKVPLDNRFELASLRSLPLWALSNVEDLLHSFEDLAKEILDLTSATGESSTSFFDVQGEGTSRRLERVLETATLSMGLTCMVLADGMGLPIAHFNAHKRADLFAAFAPIAADTMDKAGEMLDLRGVDQLLFEAGRASGGLLVRKLDVGGETFFVVAVLKKEPEGLEKLSDFLKAIEAILTG